VIPDGTFSFVKPSVFFFSQRSSLSRLAMSGIEEVKDGKVVRETSAPSYSSPGNLTPQQTIDEGEMEKKKTMWQRFKEPGSVWQIIFAALLAIAIGLIVTTQVDEVPEAAIAILAIPGQLWLRALRAVGKLCCS
jgi:hypothetical protein